MKCASFWTSGSSYLVRQARNGSVHGAIMAIISWAEGVISVAEPPIVSESSVSGILAGSGLLLPVSPSHTTDGLKSLSRNMLGGPHRVLR